MLLLGNDNNGNQEKQIFLDARLMITLKLNHKEENLINEYFKEFITSVDMIFLLHTLFLSYNNNKILVQYLQKLTTFDQKYE